MKHLISLLLLTPCIGFAQNAQMEINKQVWEPFIQAYSTYDADLFNSIHTDEILRISSDGIQEGVDYKISNSKIFMGLKAIDQKMSIAFRFDQRVAKENVAYEVGTYRISLNDAKGSKEFYGRFHVVLRKVENTWKIAQDWDTQIVMEHAVNQADFKRGKKMNEFTDR